MVLDGTILEIKTVSGTIKTLGLEFKRGYKQGKSLLSAKNKIPGLYVAGKTAKEATTPPLPVAIPFYRDN